MLLQEGREFAGVEMIGVVGDGLELGGRDGLGRESVVTEAALRAYGIAEAAPVLSREPVRHEVQLRKALRKHQRVIIEVIRGAGRPTGESRALFERRIALPEEFRLGHADARERAAQGRPGSFTHADDGRVG